MSESTHRDCRTLRTEPASNDVRDYGVGKAVENLPKLREKLKIISNSYLDIQQDILETFIDRGELRQLSQPTIANGGSRIPGLKLDNPRQLALMQALVWFSHVCAHRRFTTSELHPVVVEALGQSTPNYKLASLRYDLSKLRARGLIEKLPRSRAYQLTPSGYRLSLIYFKLFQKIYGPLVAGVVHPESGDSKPLCAYDVRDKKLEIV